MGKKKEHYVLAFRGKEFVADICVRKEEKRELGV